MEKKNTHWKLTWSKLQNKTCRYQLVRYILKPTQLPLMHQVSASLMQQQHHGTTKKSRHPEEEREAAGFSRIHSFSEPIKKRGWPRKRKEGNLANGKVIVAKTPPSSVKPIYTPTREVTYPVKKPVKNVVVTWRKVWQWRTLEESQRPSRGDLIRLPILGLQWKCLSTASVLKCDWNP